jgi:hypothetical protein
MPALADAALTASGFFTILDLLRLHEARTNGADEYPALMCAQREYDQHMPALIRSADCLKAFFSAGERAEARRI